MAQHGGEASEDFALGRQKVTRQQNCGRAFGAVTQQGQGRRPFLAGAQHIGGADIAGADLAHIAAAGNPGEKQSKRDRAQDIA